MQRFIKNILRGLNALGLAVGLLFPLYDLYSTNNQQESMTAQLEKMSDAFDDVKTACGVAPEPCKFPSDASGGF